MSVRLVILGLLQTEPLHGYELKRLIEERMGDWNDIAFGSIYFALDKMAEEGLIEKVAEERQGGRPSRSVYAITPEGRQEFMRLLREIWGEIERPEYDINLGVFFMDALPRQDVLDYLRKRVSGLKDRLGYVSAHQAETMERLAPPPRINALFDHARIHLEAELSWTQALLDKVSQGEYS